MNIRHCMLASALVLGQLFSPLALAAPALNIDELLNLVRQGQARDNNEFQERMNRFNADLNQQKGLLEEARRNRAELESASTRKEAEFSANETRLLELQGRLTERMGGLKELFGVLQQVSADTQSTLEDSVISAEIPGRGVFLAGLIKKAGSSSELPSIEELETLWYEMTREMAYSGKVSRFERDVVLPDGSSETRSVIRIGGFNLVSDGKYLAYDMDTAKVIELPAQPSNRILEDATALSTANDAAMTPFWIDPARGQLLKIFGQSASFSERVDQGGTVGYVTMVLGVLALLIAFARLIALGAESRRIQRQISEASANSNNALGRLMAVHATHRDKDIETLELHLAEAISAEVPKLTRGIGWIKIVSVVAPLLGLLGTVTGMIDVFETMSLFGTGDPKLMANGISQALVTTVQGLVVAIPCVFLYNITNNRSRDLIILLEERATGIMARATERQAKAA